MTVVDPWTLRRRQDDARWEVALAAARSVLPSTASVVLLEGELRVRLRCSRWLWLTLGAVQAVVRADTRDRVQVAVQRRAGFRPVVVVR